MVSQTFKKLLIDTLGVEAVRVDEPMAQHTTFRIGGPAEVYVIPHSVDEVGKVVALCRSHGVSLRIVGLGSDLLVADKGLRGVVMQIAENLSVVSHKGECLVVQAGASNADVARAACGAGLAGFEFACGIPGTVGGAAIMNAGAYGGEFKEVARSLKCFTPEGQLVEVSAQQAQWSYRHSMMDGAGYIVVAATLALRPDSSSTIQARMDDLHAQRSAKQPLELPSAGSTFKRPEGYFVGKLVEEAGLRGYRTGGAQVSEKHTGFVVNAGGATAQDVRNLIAHVQAKVFDHSGVQLEPEVRMWGFER